MNNRIRSFLATIVFSLVPLLLWAEQIETQISADTIMVQQGDIVYAAGNVVVRHGKNKLKAQVLEFNQKSNNIKFTDLQEFYDGKAINLSAKEAEISSDLSDGIIRVANLLVDDAIKIQAQELN